MAMLVLLRCSLGCMQYACAEKLRVSHRAWILLLNTTRRLLDLSPTPQIRGGRTWLDDFQHVFLPAEIQVLL